MPFALRTRTPLLPAALAFVSFGFVLVGVRVLKETPVTIITLLEVRTFPQMKRGYFEKSVHGEGAATRACGSCFGTYSACYYVHH